MPCGRCVCGGLNETSRINLQDPWDPVQSPPQAKTEKIFMSLFRITIILLFIGMNTTAQEAVYSVTKLNGPLKIDGDWNKAQWKNIQPVNVNKQMGPDPKFTPVVEAKMMYDENNVFVIFRVKDRYVKSTVQEFNGPVSENSCVEFFFSPDSSQPLKYFNLEVNAGGTPLIFFVSKALGRIQKTLERRHKEN